MNLEVGDLVLCNVEKIVGTIVFVKIDGPYDIKEGTIIFSEIAPGRIRNIRDHVVPKKTIVCKVLKITHAHTALSLRRVTQKEKKEIIEEYKQEKSYKSILKTILKDKAREIIEKIKEDHKLYDFMERAKEDGTELIKITSKDEAEKIRKILNTQKEKKITIKKEIKLETSSSDGISLIKKILGNVKEVEINYISAGKYLIKGKSTDPKSADNKLKNAMLEIQDKIKETGKQTEIELIVKEK